MILVYFLSLALAFAAAALLAWNLLPRRGGPVARGQQPEPVVHTGPDLLR